MHEFKGHPPLSLGMHSLLYSLLGDHTFVDKVYPLTLFCLTAAVLCLIWRELGVRNAWVPLLLWISFPSVSWACANNMLENTMTLFTCLSVYFYLKAEHTQRPMHALLSGMMVTAAFLTKGPVGLFPLAFPALHTFIIRKEHPIRALVKSMKLLTHAVLPMMILVSFSEAARNGLEAYWNEQIVGSFKNEVTVESRFFILKKLAEQIAPMLILLLILFAFSRRHADVLKEGYRKNARESFAFLFLALCGILPVMVSMKQSGFYIIPSFPFLAIAFGIMAAPLTDALMKDMQPQTARYKGFLTITTILLFSAVAVTYANAGKAGRDKELLDDVHHICQKIEKGSIIGIIPEMWQQWTLHGYLSRYGHISLDMDTTRHHKYLLLPKGMDCSQKDYVATSLKLKKHALFIRVNK
jgi:4-amino-4-deoxy-L-arabinose transferase-like glycosyltransferase